MRTCVFLFLAVALLSLNSLQQHHFIADAALVPQFEGEHRTNCTECSPPQCGLTNCSGAAPYACVAGPAVGGCAATPKAWESPSACTDCCDTSVCGITCPKCNNTVCNTRTCGAAAPYMCLAGKDAGACGQKSTWKNTPTCTQCCDTADCLPTTVPPWGPPSCYPCNSSICGITPLPCTRQEPVICLDGPAKGGCGNQSTWNNAKKACDSCCDLTPCFPPPPSPRPKDPWSLVPPSRNCTGSSFLPSLSPDPGATEWGGHDVSKLGCKAFVTQSCCGYTPRFNWILSTCHKNKKKRNTMACTHEGANTSALELYYLAAYQWNGTRWVKDPRSSVSPPMPGSILDLDKYFLGGGWPQDWDKKYGATTASHNTSGLGPPGMMFVISAKQFSWSSLFILNQITVNRGPGGEVLSDNCWSSSSGEFDIIEPPFWAGVVIPKDRLYTTVTADGGRCLPVEKNIPPRFAKHCTDKNCCEMCSCPPGYVCFGHEDNIAFTPMGCIPKKNASLVPKDATIFDVDGCNTTCGKYFGGVAGGAESTAYFQQQNVNGTGEVIYAAVIDADGVFVYRWPAPNDQVASSVWPGIHKFATENVLRSPTPLHSSGMHFGPPCTDWSQRCALYEPSCQGECPLISAAGNFGLNQLSGAYASESARDRLNWWNYFQSTGQGPRMKVSGLPKYQSVPHFTPPMPFYCNVSCSAARCHSPDRCPVEFPYMCTRGDGNNGCSNSSSFWPYSAHCGSCCDVRECVKPCVDCTAAQCANKTCSIAAPFLCTGGPEKGGCSSKRDFWPRQSQCFSCCSFESCPNTNDIVINEAITP